MDELNLATQFATALATIENPPLDTRNPHFNSMFASLKATQKVIKKVCVDNGISYHQALGRIDTEQYIRSWVQNLTGEVMELSCVFIPRSENPQRLGSYITYCKRYVAQIDWGLVGEEEEDGEIAATVEDEELKAAKRILFEATKSYAQRKGLEVNEVLTDIKGERAYDPENKDYLYRKADELNNG